MDVARSVPLFVLAAVLEIGGAWLVWQGVREHRGWVWVGAGVLALGLTRLAQALVSRYVLQVEFLPGWLAALATCRRVVRLPRGYWRTECRCIARAAFIVLGAVCMAAVVLPLDIDRPFTAVTFAAGLLLQLVSRWLIRRAALRRRDDRARTAGPHLGSEARSAAVHE